MVKSERLGVALRRLREERGWSLDYVGKICDTSGANIWKIEHGQPKEYRLELLEKLAGAYGLHLYELFALIEQIDLVLIETLSKDEIDLLKAYRRLTPRQRVAAKSVTETLVLPETID